MAPEPSDNLLNISQVIAVTALGPVSINDLSAFIDQLDNPNAYYFAVCRDSKLATWLQDKELATILVSRDSMSLMSKYLQNTPELMTNGAQADDTSPEFQCAQLALFASGHSKFKGRFTDCRQLNLLTCTIAIKPKRPITYHCQILFCHREPCLQSTNRHTLIKQLKQFAHSLDSSNPNWCHFTLTDCLGTCSPGGAAIIYQHHALGARPVHLRHIERLTIDQWHDVLRALHQATPVTTHIPKFYLNGYCS